MENNNQDSFDIEDRPTSLESLITQELNNLPVLSPTCSIFRIPNRLRHVEEKAYVSKVVSFGPLHHGAKGLKGMEEHKKRYLKDFIERTQVNLGFYIELVRKKEEELRACYAEAIEFSSDEFVKIILMDAAFIVGVLLRKKFTHLIDNSDRIYHAPWMLNDVGDDMLLLENQPPFFIINDLFEIWKESVQFSDSCPSIFDLSHCLFENRLILNRGYKLKQIDPSEVKHFVDFLRLLHLPLGKQPRGVLQKIKSPTMTELHNAGVKFKVGPSLQFKEGILQIPKFQFEAATEILLRNLIAFEECYCVQTAIIDYFAVIDCFVDDEKDVDLLVKYGILDSFPGDNKEVSSLINKLVDGASLNTRQFLYASLCKDLNTYSKTYWHKWKTNLNQNYLKTPWAILYLVASVILLTLTLIQTAFSVISA